MRNYNIIDAVKPSCFERLPLNLISMAGLNNY